MKAPGPGLPRGLILWAAMALYFLFGPLVHDRFFVSDAEPLSIDVQLPMVTEMGYATVDAVELSDFKGGTYQIVGWGFPTLDSSIPASDYDRQLVLSSGGYNYVFAATGGLRGDIRSYFKRLDVDAHMSGFAASVSRYAIRPGSYAAGFVFIRKGTGEANYVSTGRCLRRTPNRLVLEDRDAQTCLSLTSADIGTPVAVDADLPSLAGDPRSGMDALDAMAGRQGVYSLLGWAFSASDTSEQPTAYYRQVVLIAPAGNYVFRALVIPRPDVNDSFSELGMDLALSGFSAYLDASAVPDGVYKIGVVFTKPTGGQAYLIENGWCLRASGGTLELLGVGEAACAQVPDTADAP